MRSEYRRVELRGLYQMRGSTMSKVIRCDKCRYEIDASPPYAPIDYGTNEVTCPFCGKSNERPEEYL